LAGTRLRVLSTVVLSLASLCAAADGDEPARFAVHGQFTYVEQETSGFSAPYAGANSLSPRIGAETTDATLSLGARLWTGAEVWLDAELDQGRGLDNTLGAAGFPSGEAYKVGKNQPYLRMPRLFVRQTLNLDDARDPVEPAAHQMGLPQSTNRIVFTIGKLSVTDVFDASVYAHDQRSDFLNWTAIDTGTFDYAADAWGYTVGAAVEWYQGVWTLRAGVFDLSTVPNSAHLDPGFHEFQTDLEVERRHAISGHPGKVMLTAFDSRGRMGLLEEAVADVAGTGAMPDIATVRRYRSRTGISVVLEQELIENLGFFARAGRASGNVEAYEFTDVDRTVAAGLSLQGGRWHRADDTVGLAGIINGISASRENYLNAGGLGILVGDGRLPNPGPEKILETYYSLAVLHSAHVSFDYQWIDHPAYNRDRGPASVYAVRVHAQF
jgi:high affinity Mn2+ porin